MAPVSLAPALPGPAATAANGSGHAPARPAERPFARALDQARDRRPPGPAGEEAAPPAVAADAAPTPNQPATSGETAADPNPADGGNPPPPAASAEPPTASPVLTGLLASRAAGPSAEAGSAGVASETENTDPALTESTGRDAARTPGRTVASGRAHAGTNGLAPGVSTPSGPGFAARLAAEAPSAAEARTAREAMPSPGLPGRPAESAGAVAGAPLPAPPTAGSLPASSPPVTEVRLPAGPHSADFGTQLGAQLSTFVRNGIEHARLHLNPEDMGPVQVRIQIDGANASVQLSADQSLTRQALEQALPQLASSLREAGLTLTGGGVFQQPRQGGQRSDGGASRNGGRGPLDGVGAAEGPEQRLHTPQRRGVVDLVA